MKEDTAELALMLKREATDKRHPRGSVHGTSRDTRRVNVADLFIKRAAMVSRIPPTNTPSATPTATTNSTPGPHTDTSVTTHGVRCLLATSLG